MAGNAQAARSVKAPRVVLFVGIVHLLVALVIVGPIISKSNCILLPPAGLAAQPSRRFFRSRERSLSSQGESDGGKTSSMSCPDQCQLAHDDQTCSAPLRISAR